VGLFAGRLKEQQISEGMVMFAADGAANLQGKRNGVQQLLPKCAPKVEKYALHMHGTPHSACREVNREVHGASKVASTCAHGCQAVQQVSLACAAAAYDHA
jgi:hypothetical protein